MERTKSALRFFVLAVLLVSALVRAEGIDGIDPNAANTTPPGRLVTSILWFENKADPQEEHWGHAIKGFLGNQFGEVQTIQLRGGINYARTELGLQKGSALNAEQARRIGEIVQAQRVIWGSYQHQGDKWQVTVYLLNVATGQMLDPLTTVSTDWYDIRDTMTEHILKQLKIKPTKEEQKKLRHREMTSHKALEWRARAQEAWDDGKLVSEAENYLRNSIAADPECADLYLGLASVLGTKGNIEEAEKMVQRALEIRPDFAEAYLVLGVVQIFQNKYTEAEIQLEKSLRLKPDYVEALSYLAQLYLVQGDVDKAIAYNEKAIVLEPMDASLHAHLGWAYANKHDRDKAMAELRQAEHFAVKDSPDYMNTEQMLCQAYELLGEVRLAVEHYERFVTVGRNLGVNPEMISQFESRAEVLKASLTPTYVSASMPQRYTEEMLQNELKRRLAPLELAMIVNPIASNSDMKRWAQQLTEGAESEFDKAKALFDGLLRRIQQQGPHETRTAQEVFTAWSDPNESFICQEYAKLYLALARAVDLNAFYVHLERDYQGKIVYHDCDIVFIKGKALLVDPAYRWFGIPHKEFNVLDDLQSIAHHYFQHVFGEQDVAQCRLADKLHPDYAWGQLSLATALWNTDKQEEARLVLEKAEHLEPGRWDAYRLRGQMAVDTEQWNTAVTELQRAIELNPEDAVSHYLLGQAFEGLGRQEEAREEYRVSLQYDYIGAVTDASRRAIVQINEKIGIETAPEFKTAEWLVASEKGDTETMKRMIAEGTDVNVKDTTGHTALIVATYSGQVEVVKLLLENDADINVKEKNGGSTALMSAAENGHTEIVELLIDGGADVNVKDKDQGVTALMAASHNGHTDIVKLLIDAGANVNIKEKSQHGTALMLAVLNGHMKIVKLLIDAGADVNVKEKSQGATALILASQNGHTDIVKLLIDAGADVNVKDKIVNTTALMMAVRNGNKEIVKLLLNAKGDVNAKNAKGGTALMVAVRNGQTEIVKLLLEAKADINIQFTDGRTVLWIAVQYGHIEVAKLLIDAGADVNVKEKSEDGTVLLMAAQEGHTEIVKLLIDAGADVNVKSSNDWTALMLAAQNGHEAIVKLLLEAGVDVNTKSISSGTVLMLAAESGHSETVRLLLDSGADIEAKSTSGATALWLAAFNGHVKCVKLLLERGADVNVEVHKNGNKYRPLDIAYKSEIIQLLKESGAKKHSEA